MRIRNILIKVFNLLIKFFKVSFIFLFSVILIFMFISNVKECSRYDGSYREGMEYWQ
jgi:hypothetical protein